MLKVLDIIYTCVVCGHSPNEPTSMICPLCGGDLRGSGFPSVTNTRDSFGIGRNFIHENDDGTKKEITTFKEWERAGYKDALSCHKGDVKEKIKRKMDKIRHDKGQRVTIGV